MAATTTVSEVATSTFGNTASTMISNAAIASTAITTAIASTASSALASAMSSTDQASSDSGAVVLSNISTTPYIIGSGGGPEFMQFYPHVAWPYIVIASAASIIGSIGNLASLMAIYLNKNLRQSRNAFLVNLAIADLVVTAFADPLSVVGLIAGESYFMERPGLCDVVASFCLGACVTALFSIGGISFHQCLHICYPDLFAKVFSPKINIGMCFVFWFVGILMALPPLVGWTHNYYDPKYLECFFNRVYSLSYTVFFTVVVVFTPVMIISISFIKIYLHFRASKKRLAQMDGGKSSEKSNEAQVKLARTLFIIFFVFVACWAPIALLIVIDFVDRAPMAVHLYILLLAHMHSSANPIVFAITNKHYRDGYRMVAVCVFTCGRKRKPNNLVSKVHPSTVTRDTSGGDSVSK